MRFSVLGVVRVIVWVGLVVLGVSAAACSSSSSTEDTTCGPAPANATLCGYCKDVGCVYCPLAWGPCKSSCGGCFPDGGTGGSGGGSGGGGGGSGGGSSCGDSQHAMMSCPDGSSRCCSVNMVCCYDSANNGAIGCEFSGFCQ
jgi:hypothetical protein